MSGAVVVLMRPGRISSAGSATAFSPCTERDRSIAPSRRTGSGGSSADSSTSRLTANLGPCAFSGSGLSPRLLSQHERVVVWEEDSREDRILKEQAPPGFFAEYEISHRFEAMVYYNRTSNKLDHIDEVEHSTRRPTDEEAWAFWKTIRPLRDRSSSPEGKGLEGS